MEKVCKNKGITAQQNVQAQATEEDHTQKEQVFVATCFVSKNRVVKGWLINSGCINHMTSNEIIFRKIGRSCDLKVRIGNGELIEAKGKGEVLINLPLGTKEISYFLSVPTID